jgi:hypothetical protein
VVPLANNFAKKQILEERIGKRNFGRNNWKKFWKQKFQKKIEVKL